MRSEEAGKKKSKFISVIFIPIRALARAGDFYVTSLTGLGGGAAAYGNVMGCPTPQMPTVPRSFSVSSSSKMPPEQGLRDLVRLGSARRRSGKVDEAELRRSKSAQPVSRGVAAVSRSRTVACWRIDEDNILELGEEDEVGLLLGRAVDFPRTRSYRGWSKRG